MSHARDRQPQSFRHSDATYYLQVRTRSGLTKHYRVSSGTHTAKQVSKQMFDHVAEKDVEQEAPSYHSSLHPDHWSVAVEDVDGNKNVTYYKHVQGNKYRLEAVDFTSQGGAKEDVLKKMADIIDHHHQTIIGTTAHVLDLNSLRKNEMQGVPEDQFRLAHLKPDSLHRYIISRSGETIIPTQNMSRQTCQALAKKKSDMGKKYERFKWEDNTSVDSVAKQQFEGDDMYQSTYGSDTTKGHYALVVVSATDKEMIQHRQTAYTKGPKVFPTILSHWACPQQDDGKYIHHFLTDARQWHPLKNKEHYKDVCKDTDDGTCLQTHLDKEQVFV